MKRSSTVLIRKLSPYLIPIVTLVLVCLQDLLLISIPIQDSFHIGEYFTASTNLLNGTTQAPITIHGALDFLPALLCRAIWGVEHYMLPTIALNKVLTTTSVLVLYGLIYRVTDKLRTGLAFPLLLATAVTATRLVGYRDLFFLISLWLFYELTERENSHLRNLAGIALSITLAGGLFWSFDRGIAATISIGTGLLLKSFRNKLYLLLIAVSGGMFLSVLIMLKNANILDYFENVRILFQTSSQWSYGFSPQIFIAQTFAVFVNTGALTFLIYKLWQNKSLQSLPMLVVLILANLFMLRIGINRADISHLHMTLWVPLIILGFSTQGVDIGTLRPKGYILTAISSLAILFGVGFYLLNSDMVSFAVLMVTVYFISKSTDSQFAIRLNTAAVYWLALIALLIGLKSLYFTATAPRQATEKNTYATPIAFLKPPLNKTITDAGTFWASSQINSVGVGCLLDLTNSGIINALTDKPTCSRFLYPVYATLPFERELISSFKKGNPAALVYSTTQWYYSIDKKPMNQRFPTLDAYIKNAYPIEECSEGYCIRKKFS
jgi:hypothetical protein